MQFNGALTEEKQYRTNRNLAMDGWIRVQWEKMRLKREIDS